ncbi:flagellar biosynthesis protein FlhA [Paracoccus aerodenitrificans]|uniref:flagellar biosynthesis protein FlhA n=1 Tax=Paracoccus aerodenitrificans TaxID=3017781 RepID=UPI0022F087AD|nr:FHIPEP family type III secretion protein [Paracoccus aerodenitrificans]WBU63959.1 FHIPEP family type III secretion protein [Paracoccus aerodenitrificans]
MRVEPRSEAGPAGNIKGVAITSGLVLIVLTMVIPIPAGLLDLGIALSIATATMILVMASTVEKPTDFQAFPVLLLISLVIRLSLNVSSTRLILSEGHTGSGAAGHVISGFSQFVAGGSLMIGITIFAVISAVNFIVITKGAGRMAEVSARFALDSLPGKQLAIDGDLSSGAIDHAEARRRRGNDQREISFFGSLDGTSKFVKGDAIAGIVITLINLLVGIAMGVIVHGLPVGQALDSYSRLTIGDGLVSQVPSLITSMAAALLLSRGGATEETSTLILGQALADWRAPAVVSGTMLLMAAIPGMPGLLFIGLSAVLAVTAVLIRRRRKSAVRTEQVDALPDPPAVRRIGDDLDMDEITVEIGSDLVMDALDSGRGLATRIGNLRSYMARSFGIVMPEVRITDDGDCARDEYQIRIHGIARGRGRLEIGRLLALGDDAALSVLDGPEIREPVFAAQAKWIDTDRREDATISGATIVTPMEVLSTHLMEVVKSNLSELLTLTALQRLISELKEMSDPARASSYRTYFDSMIPEKIAPELLLGVLRQMLDEGLSIRNLPLITDAIHEFRGAGSPDAVFEAIRPRLRGQITQRMLSASGRLNLVQLHPGWEAEFVTIDEGIKRGATELPVAELARRLTDRVKSRLASVDAGADPIIAAPDHRRRQIRNILRSHGVTVPVLGLGDIDPAADINLLGSIEVG